MAVNAFGQPFDPAKTPGAMSAPPADAPREVTQPVSSDMTAWQLDQARANERELAPLQFQPGPAPTPIPARPLVPTAAAPARTATIVQPGASRLRMPGVARPPVVATPAPTIVLTDAEPAASHAPGGLEATRGEGMPSMTAGGLDPTSAPVRLGQGASTSRIARPPVDPATAAHLASPLAQAAQALHAQRALSHQPAASDTDSPSRGMPTQSADPGKQITGGFGDAQAAQYFPLDGSELRELIRGLMSVLSEQMEHDLRFSMALCYPRVAARVEVIVDAFSAGPSQYDPSFTITKHMPPHEKTPIDVARQVADEVCFVIKAGRIEMTADGTSISPPNAVREELGLPVPRKQAIGTPHGRLIVDLPADPAGGLTAGR